MSNGAATADQPTSGKEGNTLSSLERLLAQLRGNPLVALLIAGATCIAIVVSLLLWAQAPTYRVLYSNLGEADGGRIITELDSRGVPYRFSEGGQALLVPGNQVHQLRLQLAEQGLPRGGNVGFELMDDQAFGVSQFAEQINFQRGLEGELSRSIESLGPVERVRVHLSMAKPSVFVRDREPAKASVILTLHGGRALSEGQVNAIVHMVSSSVPELAVDDVTVVDQSGRLLSREAGNGRDLDGTQLDYIAEVERSYQRRIENILIPILGRDNVRAQIAAQVDFAQREETSERFAPNQTPQTAAVRSRQYGLDINGEGMLTGGIPGALSNTPPGVALSPIAQPEGEDADAEEVAPQELQNLRQNDVVNYEVDRNVSHTRYRRGQVQRLSAAVVVNFRDEIDEEGEWHQVALNPQEIDQIERLVRQAMGFSVARGDEIEVVNSRFSPIEDTAGHLEWWQDPELRQLVMTLLRYLPAGLAILLLYLLVLRPLIKRYSLQAPAATTPVAPTFQAQVGGNDEEAAEETETTYPKPRRKHKSSAYEQNLSDLRGMAQEDPRMVAMIVRNWMNKP